MAWFALNILLPLLPILIVGFYFWHRELAYAALLRDGQLYFYSTALCAGSMSDLFSKDVKGDATALFLLLLFLIILSTGAFAIAAICNHASQTNPNQFQLSDPKNAKASIASAITSAIIATFVHWWIE